MNDPYQKLRVVITMPVLDDWQAAAQLCRLIDAELLQAPHIDASLLLIDDGSVAPFDEILSTAGFSRLSALHVLVLARNLGHQRAIAISLTYIHHEFPCDVVVVMDADGEDRAEDALRLIDRLIETKAESIVFAGRARRTEGLAFQVSYWFYRVVHRIVTGRGIRVGNFSAIPQHILSRLVTLPEMWNHYAASVISSRTPYITVPCERGTRLAGRSKMNPISLVMHGISALSVYPEVAVRILIGSMIGTLTFTLVLFIALGIGLFSGRVFPTWTAVAIAAAFTLLAQGLTSSLLFAFLSLGFRTNLGFLPLRDFRYFISRCVRVYPK